MKRMIRWTVLPAGAVLLLCMATTAVPVVSVAGDRGGSAATGEIREIKGHLPLNRLFPLFLPVSSALLLAAISFLMVTKCQGVRRDRLPVSRLPSPWAALELLEQRFREGGVEIDLLYGELASLVRFCLAERAGLAPLGMTTEEFLAGIDAQGGAFSEESELLRTFLLHCDLVKFAGAIPLAVEIREDLSAARAILSTTGREPSPTLH